MSAFSCAAKSINSTRMSISAHPWARLGDVCAVTRTRAAIHTFSAHAAPRLVAGRARVLVGPQGQQAQQDLSLAACACLGAYTSRVRMEQLQTETCHIHRKAEWQQKLLVAYCAQSCGPASARPAPPRPPRTPAPPPARGSAPPAPPCRTPARRRWAWAGPLRARRAGSGANTACGSGRAPAVGPYHITFSGHD